MDPSDAIAPWPRVLLVEDDQANRRRIRNLLVDEGIVVVAEASDGASGAQLAQELLPDVVLMDLRMPFMGGLESTRIIKEAIPLTQVIILTSYEGPLPERSAEQAGAFAYLVKGCSGGMLREMINQAWQYKIGLERADRFREAEGGTGFESAVFGEPIPGTAASWTYRVPSSKPESAGEAGAFAESGSLEDVSALPDSVPDEMVERFGREARQTVRYRSSRRYRVARSFRSRAHVVRDREVLTVALIVFGISVFALAFAGAIAYMVVLWPWTGLFIVTPLLVLLPLSFLIASRIVRGERGRTEDRGGKQPQAW